MEHGKLIKILMQKSFKLVSFSRRFIQEHLSELRILSPTTFVSVHETNAQFSTPSAIHFLYRDSKNNQIIISQQIIDNFMTSAIP